MNNTGAFYKINIDFFKQSGAIHEMYLTGKFSRNFAAVQITIDNLLWQMQGVDMKVKLNGKQYPMFTLGGY